MISVFTPSHEPERLGLAYASLQKQNHHVWEWILLVTDIDKVPEQIKSDTRVKFFIQTEKGNVGKLKKECCGYASGKYLLELDHDDELEPECIARVLDSFEEHPDVDFVYSSCFEVKDGAPAKPYSDWYGWKYQDFNGRPATMAFPPSPQSFGFIWYAPNHVRAWKKSFYDSIGGYDETLGVCDDHDLLCRTYIEGKIYKITDPLYTYHHHDTNTSGTVMNAKVQELTVQLHDKYIEKMVLRWCKDNDLPAVDLCCFANKASGYIGVDRYPHPDVDVVADLDRHWPFDDGSVGLFRLQDALEHIKDPLHAMKELYRCLAPNGWVLIEVPSTDGRGAYQDPTHVSFWNSNSFWYYTKSDQAKYINTPVKFQLNRILNYYPSEYHKLHDIVYTKAHLVKLDGDIIPPGGRNI